MTKAKEESEGRVTSSLQEASSCSVMRKGYFIPSTFYQTCARIIGFWCSLLLLRAEVGASPAPDALNGVTLQAGKLSVYVEGIPLREVMAEVSRLNHTPIVWLSEEGQEDPVSLEFAELPLLEGVERILQRHNFIVCYEPYPSGTQLTQIWIASNRKATQPPPPQTEEKKSLSAPARGQAAGEQQERSTSPEREEWQSVMERAVSAPDPLTRTNAVRYLGTHGQNTPQTRATLEQIARSDANVQVRNAAAEALQRRE
jgi:HEAT repeats